MHPAIVPGLAAVLVGDLLNRIAPPAVHFVVGQHDNAVRPHPVADHRIERGVHVRASVVVHRGIYALGLRKNTSAS